MRILATVVVGLVVGALAGCGGPASQAPPNSVVVVLESPPLHADPRIGNDQASSRLYQLALSGLLTKDPRGNLVPDLAASWEVLDDGRRWRFRLRDGVRFHDGRAFSSADVVWTFGSILDGTVATPKSGALTQVERIEAVDPLTVDFVMKEPYGALLANLTSYLGIVPDGISPDEMEANPVGTGPFRVVARGPDTVEFAAFDDHFAGRPRLDRVVLRAVPDATVRALELRKGSAHLTVNGLTPDMVPAFREDAAFRVVEDPGSNYVYLGLNIEDRLLADRRVRRAMALALDRRQLVDTLWRGLGVLTESVLPPGHWAHHDGLEPIPYDPAAARALLDKAGHPDPDGDGPAPRFALTYKTSTDETALLQAQIIQAMLAEVGIAVDIRSYEFATFFADIKQGDFQVFSLTRTGVVDPDIFHLILHSEQVPPAGANRGRYANAAFDRAVEEGARRSTPEERRPFYLEAQEIFARDLPYISLFNRVNVAVMPAGLAGYANYPSGELYSLKNVYWSSE